MKPQKVIMHTKCGSTCPYLHAVQQHPPTPHYAKPSTCAKCLVQNWVSKPFVLFFRLLCFLLVEELQAWLQFLKIGLALLIWVRMKDLPSH